MRYHKFLIPSVGTAIFCLDAMAANCHQGSPNCVAVDAGIVVTLAAQEPRQIHHSWRDARRDG
jgi:hypothetical protein